jgi:hypothetical protein
MKLDFSRCHAVRQKEKDLFKVEIIAVKYNNVFFSNKLLRLFTQVEGYFVTIEIELRLFEIKYHN